MTVARELITLLGYDLDEAGQKKAELGFQKLQSLSTAVVAGVGAIAGALTALLITQTEAGDEAETTSRKLGITAEAYQELKYAAQQSGIEQGELSTALREIGRRSSEAASGNKSMAAAFRTLGVSVKDASGHLKSSPDLMAEVADALNKIPDAGKRTALAMEIFGRSGSSMLPLLLEGAEGIAKLRKEAQELGFVFDNDTAKRAEALSDQLNKLKMGVTGIARRLYAALLPVFEKWIDALIKLIVNNRELIDRWITKAANAVKYLSDAFAAGLEWAKRNGDYLLILGGILAAVTLAFTAAGTAATIWSLLPLVGWAALIAFVAAVIQDIWRYVNGDGKTAIGALFDYFKDVDINSEHHPLVKILKLIIDLTKDAIDTTNEFFKTWFDAVLEQGWMQTFKDFVVANTPMADSAIETKRIWADGAERQRLWSKRGEQMSMSPATEPAMSAERNQSIVFAPKFDTTVNATGASASEVAGAVDQTLQNYSDMMSSEYQSLPPAESR